MRLSNDWNLFADMTIAEDKIRELEAHGTAGATTVKTAAAIGLTLLLAQYSSLIVDSREAVKLFSAGTQGTSFQVLSLRITELDLFGQLNRVYEEILTNQVDLDEDSKRILYSNLWNLYT